MNAVNYYSVFHFIFWFFSARYSSIGWLLFLILSMSWELLELVLPFNFALETIQKKIADIIVNILGYGSGLLFNGSIRE